VLALVEHVRLVESKCAPAENAKSCEPEGPQDLTQRLSHLRLEPASEMRWRREAAALAIESPNACEG
jgi:hypothetical protein